jgi:hypothetical protein
MQRLYITTIFPVSKHAELACQAAVEQGFNCYSKSTVDKDVQTDITSIFYYKWKGKTLEVTITKIQIGDYPQGDITDDGRSNTGNTV